jgi:hypothetical protein
MYSAGKICVGCMAILLVFAACSGNNQEPKPYAGNLHVKPAKLAQIDTNKYTTVQWERPDRNFGTITEGDSVVMYFKFTNTGVHPLFISAVKPSCGCTMPRYPEEPVMPGQSGEMRVTFNSINYPGEAHKTVVVTTNTSNGVKHVLTMTGRVLEKGK